MTFLCISRTDSFFFLLLLLNIRDVQPQKLQRLSGHVEEHRGGAAPSDPLAVPRPHRRRCADQHDGGVLPRRRGALPPREPGILPGVTRQPAAERLRAWQQHPRQL